MPERVPEVCVVGPQPPPRHGVSTVNEAVGNLADGRGIRTLRLDTAPVSLSRSLSVRLRRFGRIWNTAKAAASFAGAGRGPIYISLSGGLGLVWEAWFAWIARRAGARVIVHHHSFRYLDQPYWPMRLLVRAAGTGAIHVALGADMAAALRHRYVGIGETLVLSNAAFVGPPLRGECASARTPLTVGLLSNLSADKGLHDFLSLVEASLGRGLPWKFIAAGPFENPSDAGWVTARIKGMSNAEYRGPLYGEAKTNFLREIDVFVFPTQYRHEAEPLVVLEALRCGRPVIAYGRGCIRNLLADGGGEVIPPGTEFTGAALNILEVWRKEGGAFRQRRAAAAQRFEELHLQSSRALEMLLDIFSQPS